MNQKNKEEWVKDFDEMYELIDGEKADEMIKGFISTLLSKEREKYYSDGINSAIDAIDGEKEEFGLKKIQGEDYERGYKAGYNKGLTNYIEGKDIEDAKSEAQKELKQKIIKWIEKNGVGYDLIKFLES